MALPKKFTFFHNSMDLIIQTFLRFPFIRHHSYTSSTGVKNILCLILMTSPEEVSPTHFTLLTENKDLTKIIVSMWFAK